MEFENYVRVTEEMTNSILEQAGVEASTVYRNTDNTFTAVFNDVPQSEAQSLVAKADKTIQVVMPEALEYDQPTVNPNIKSEVIFGFIAEPAGI